MPVKVLHIIEYEDAGGPWHTRDIVDPTWDLIEAAIRRLDKCLWPAIWLFLTADKDEVPDFEVMGGESDYWIACSVGGFHQRRFCDPSQGEEEIAVWTSDQGFSDSAKHICHDLEVVLRAARHFYDTGDFDPSIPWERYR